MTGLLVLDLSWCEISELCTKPLVNLIYLHISYTKISELETKPLGKLQILNANSSQLTNLNTLFLTDLIQLIIYGTEILDLQFPENSKLTYLEIERTNIRKLNLTKILTLEKVYCSDNQEVIVNAGVAKLIY